MIPALLTAFQSLGLKIFLDGDGRLIVNPRNKITPDIRTIIERHREEIVVALAQPDPLEGKSRIDRDIRRSTVLQAPHERAERAVTNCLERFTRTQNLLWSEMASIWGQVVTMQDAMERSAEQLDREIEQMMEEHAA